jgi:hypothetical protein
MVNLYPHQDRLLRIQHSMELLTAEAQAHVATEPKAWSLIGGKRKHEVWARQRSDINGRIRERRTAVNRWLDANIYSDPILVQKILDRRQEEEVRHNKIILTEYQRQERIAGSGTPQAAHARRTLARLEAEAPGVIRPYKDEQETKKQAEAEARRQADEEASKQGGGGPGRGRKPTPTIPGAGGTKPKG